MNRQHFTLDEIELQLAQLEKEKRSFFSIIAGFIKTLLQIAILPALVYLVFAFLLGVAQITQNSMAPNFAEGDFVIFNRLETDYNYGDVIIVQSVEQQDFLINRIIGTPGDTVQITADLKILVNGQEVRESWKTSGELTQGTAALPFTLKEGEYFVLSDNRDATTDSRDKKIGNIQQEDILGIIVYRFKMSK